MKTLLAFISGSLVTTLAVVFAGGYHAGMVILGGFLTALGLIAFVWGLGIPRVSRWLLALQAANETVYLERGVRSAASSPLRTTGSRALGQLSDEDAQAGGNAGKPVAVIDRSEERQQKNESGQQKSKHVQSQEVLNTVQQDVVSALVNLGTPFKRAERIVLEYTECGDSFEDLFKRAVVSLRRTA